jgi:hypothetical protein
MRRSVVLAIGLVLALAMYAVGVVLLLTTDGANLIPTPGRAVVGGMVAMFATVMVFVVGFVLSATEEY